MANTKKIENRKLSLGDDFAPDVVRVNGLTISIDGNGNVKLQNGSVTVDITDDNTSVFGGNVVAYTDGSVQLKPPAQEQINDPNVIQSSVDKRAVQIGAVLGQDCDLPESLERLKGWLIYNITDDGVRQLLEPKESAPEGLVNWKIADNHVEETLKKQGHIGARLWTEEDGAAIFNNVVKGGHNDKARLGVSASDPDGRYWEGTEHRYGPGYAMVCFPDGGNRFWRRKDYSARVRGVQDVTELELPLSFII